jgi:hypothetical protein
MDAPGNALRGQNAKAGGQLYMALELSEKN